LFLRPKARILRSDLGVKEFLRIGVMMKIDLKNL
jgi:hypothetical protein